MNREEVYIDPHKVKPLGVVQTQLIKTYAEHLAPTFEMTPEEMILWFAWPVFNGAVLQPLLDKQKSLGQLSPAAKKIEEVKAKWKKMHQDCADMLEKMTARLDLGAYI